MKDHIVMIASARYANRNRLSVPVFVRDAKKAAEWYQEKLCFETGIQGHWVAVKPRNSKIVLHLFGSLTDQNLKFAAMPMRNKHLYLRKHSITCSKAVAKTNRAAAQMSYPDESVN
jgi:hypothetical protein